MPALARTGFTLKSPAFEAGDPLPERYTSQGADLSPPLEWEEVPAGTQSLVLVFERLGKGTARTHWLLYDLPPTRRALAEGIPEGSRVDGGGYHGRNDLGNLGYDGPRPEEQGESYRFVVYAVDTRLGGVGARMNLPEIRALISGQVLAEAELRVRGG